jgi:hypothetical protein
MLTRRRRPGSLLLVCLLLAAAATLSPFAAAADADAVKGGDGGGDDERRRDVKEEAEAAGEHGDGVAVAEAGGEVTAHGNATANEGSLAEMIDRALEKEFPESEGEQGGGGAWIWPGDPPRAARDLVLGGGGWVACVGARDFAVQFSAPVVAAFRDCGHGEASGWVGLDCAHLTSVFAETDPGTFNNTVAEKQVSSSRYVLSLISN